MIDKIVLLSILRGVAKATLKITTLVMAILILDVVGLGLYNVLTGAKTFSSLWLVLVIEGVVMMFFGFMGTTVFPQAATATGGRFPWSKSVRAAIREIREDRRRQVEFWLFVGIIGFILFTLGLLISSFSTT